MQKENLDHHIGRMLIIVFNFWTYLVYFIFKKKLASGGWQSYFNWGDNTFLLCMDWKASNLLGFIPLSYTLPLIMILRLSDGQL